MDRQDGKANLTVPLEDLHDVQDDENERAIAEAHVIAGPLRGGIDAHAKDRGFRDTSAFLREAVRVYCAEKVRSLRQG